MMLAGAGILSMIGLLVMFGIYLIPTIVAISRKPVNMTAAILVNVFLGWSLIGWIIALVLALGTTQPNVPYPYGYPGQQSYGPPPGAYPNAGVYQPPDAYHQGYGASSQHPYALPPAQPAPQPAWGTPTPHAYSYPPDVSDAPYGATESNGRGYGAPPPPA